MTIFFALLLTVLAFGFIAYPLVRQKPALLGEVRDDRTLELYSKRYTTYSALKELEFDFRSGILTEEDYRELEARYRNKGISILKNIDELEKGSGLEADIEKEIAQIRNSGMSADDDVRKLRRQGKTDNIGDEIEREIMQLRRGEDRFCTKCGAKHQPADRFCARCGARLKGGRGV